MPEVLSQLPRAVFTHYQGMIAAGQSQLPRCRPMQLALVQYLSKTLAGKAPAETSAAAQGDTSLALARLRCDPGSDARQAAGKK
ncbi:MAG: hypothetical protein KDA57_09645 [Planctomycetales bacterium]|nr:hypothetical protein [Planctomycetales bacterium]